MNIKDSSPQANILHMIKYQQIKFNSELQKYIMIKLSFLGEECKKCLISQNVLLAHKILTY